MFGIYHRMQVCVAALSPTKRQTTNNYGDRAPLEACPLGDDLNISIYNAVIGLQIPMNGI